MSSRKLLLLARHVLQVLHGLLHLARQRIGHAAVRPRRLQVFEDVAQLVEQALGLGHVAAPHGFFHLLQHAVEVVLGDDPVRRALVLVLRLLVLLLLHALGEFAQELVQCAWRRSFGEALDLLVRGAPVHGLAQAVLRGAQFPLRIGQIAILDLQRHRPQPVGDLR